MQHRPNQHIELGSRPSSNSESSPISNPQNFAHLPEEDDRHDQDPQRSPQGYYSLYSKICRNKPTNIAILLVLCFSIINLILLLHMGSSFFSRSDLQLQIKRSQPSQIWFLSENLKADPIMEITIIDEKTTCPSGFQPLKLGNWTGTAAGCLCENGELFNSTCKQVASEKCKTDIPRTLPIEMYEWEHSVFCVKRAVLGTDYLKKAECPAGYTECYPGGCFKGDCPITKLEISSTGTTANKFTTAEKYLVATKIPGELPLINIQITLGDIPCFARDLFAESIKNSSYPLSNFQANACNKYGLDSHFSAPLDSQSAYDSFTENFFPYMTMHLPSFEENANSTISILSSTVRMKTAKQDYCQDIDEKPSQDYFAIVFGKAAVILDPVIAFLLVFLQLLITMKILAGTTSKLDPELFDDASELKSDLICLSVMSYIMLIPRVIWTHHVGQAFWRMKESFEEYLTLGCFEGGQGSEVISDYLKVLEGLEGNYWVNLMFWFTNVSMILVYVCYEIVKRRSIIKIHTD